ncbi:MAG TPA: alpha/beta hydrolase-fold protein [Myxococcaceae bacterium]|jgi:predicted alpha/beta superfamily hydrolase
MKKTLSGLRALLPLIALLGIPLLGCSDSDSQPQVPPSSRESVPVNFAVTVPDSTPCDASVVVVGNDAALGDGQMPGLALTPGADGVFRGTAMLPTHKTILYDIVLASTGGREVDAAQRSADSRGFIVNDIHRIDLDPTVSGWSTVGDTSKFPVRFMVEAPANTPAGSEVWLSGNQPELGNWNGAGIKLAQGPTGNRYFGCIPFGTGTNLEFKVTRGSWDFVEKDAQGGEVENRRHDVVGPARLVAQVGTWRDLVPEPPRPDTITGTVAYHDVSGTSLGLKDRRLIVWMPPGYDPAGTRRYPVLYMHDGQSIMNTKTAAFGIEWQVDETAQSLIQAGQMEPIIIVGVYNTDDRIPEYTPVATAQYGGGKANDYGRLLVEVIKPLIDDKYLTKPGAEFTGVAGSSLGGLVSMYFGITRSDTFSRIGVISPSVWWADRDIVTRVQALNAKPPLRIWVDIGTNEDGSVSESEETVNDTRALRDALIAEGWVLDTDLKYLEVQGGRHHENSWAARMDQILKYLYPPVP